MLVGIVVYFLGVLYYYYYYLYLFLFAFFVVWSNKSVLSHNIQKNHNNQNI